MAKVSEKNVGTAVEDNGHRMSPETKGMSFSSWGNVKVCYLPREALADENSGSDWRIEVFRIYPVGIGGMGCVSHWNLLNLFTGVN